jgi:hypothetical protein
MKNIQHYKQHLVTVPIILLVLFSTAAFTAYKTNGAVAITTDWLRDKKEGVIACGSNQSINVYSVYYSVNRNDRFHRSCIDPLIKPGTGPSKNNSEGNGCSHQPSAGALSSGGFNRKQFNVCTRS